MTDRRLRLVVGALAAVGATVAAYLTYARYADASITCTSGGCETVQESEYAVVAGVPVAVLGLAGYILILSTAVSGSDLARTVGAVLAVTAFAFSAYLLYLQLGPIGAVCDWCVTNDVVAALLLPFAALRLRSSPRPASEPRGG